MKNNQRYNSFILLDLLIVGQRSNDLSNNQHNFIQQKFKDLMDFLLLKFMRILGIINYNGKTIVLKVTLALIGFNDIKSFLFLLISKLSHVI